MNTTTWQFQNYCRHTVVSFKLLHQSAYQYSATTDAILIDFLKTESAILVRVEFRRESALDFMHESSGSRKISTILEILYLAYEFGQRRALRYAHYHV